MSDSLPTRRCPQCAGDVPLSQSVCSTCGFVLGDNNSREGLSLEDCSACGSPLRRGMVRCRECGELVQRAKHHAHDATGETAIGVEAVIAEDSYKKIIDDADQSLRPRETLAHNPPASPNFAKENDEEDEPAESTGFAAPAAVNAGADENGGLNRRLVAWGRALRHLRLQLGLAGLLLVGGVAAWAVVSSMTSEARAPEFQGALVAPAGPLTRVAYSRDGRHIVAGAATGAVYAWKARERNLLALPEQSQAPILALALSHDGFLAASDEARRLLVWQLGGTENQTLTDFVHPITGLAIAPLDSGRFEIVLGLASGALGFVDSSGMQSGPQAHEGSVKVLTYLAGGDQFVTGGADGKLVWWNAVSRKAVGTVNAHEAEVSGIACSPDGTRVVSGDWNGEIRVWRTSDRGRSLATHQPDAVAGLAWVNTRIFSGSWDGTLRIWSEQGILLREIDTGAPIYDLAVSPDGRTIATVSSRAQVDLWRVIAE